MDKKSKKRIDVLQKRKQKLRDELSVVQRFPDDPADAVHLQAEIRKIEEELVRLKQG